MAKKTAAPSALGTIASIVPRTLWILFVITTPLVGAWLASSLAAYSNRPIGWAAACGLLLFPLLPLAWEAFALVARRRRAMTKRFLTFTDRLTLRTLVVNLVFLVGVVATHPESTFVALSTRGDWMLEGRHSRYAERARGILFGAAQGLEWLYKAVRTNPYRDPHDEAKPAPAPSGSSSLTLAPTSSESATAPEARVTGNPQPQPSATSPSRWPLEASLDPVIVSMPSEAETSIESVAHYIAEREPDPFARVKALHDWVADRIAYDGPAFLDHHLTAADAEPETVFKNRLGLCAGYAKILQALGRAAHLNIAYIPGDARLPGMKDLEGGAHAWNAVTIEGRSYLIDATWDAGHLDGREFKKDYRTDYLLAPPAVFGIDHFPDDPAWQLREPQLSVGDFLRQPMLRPGFYRRGLVLLSPLRPQVTVTNVLDVELENPQSVALDVTTLDGDACPLSVDPSTRRTRARCSLSAERMYTVEIWAAEPGASGEHLSGVGQIEVNNR